MFQYYYGFLCIQCIIHLVCFGILSETNELDNFISGLWHDFDWAQINPAFSWKTMSLAENVLQSKTNEDVRLLFESVFQQPTALLSIGGIGPHETVFLLRLIWEDRASFLALCNQGVLTGATMLLYTFYRVIEGSPKDKSVLAQALSNLF